MYAISRQKSFYGLTFFCQTVFSLKGQNLATGSSATFKWSVQHPDNWSSSSVQEWASFTASKYAFPTDIRAKVLVILHGFTGKMLTSMTLQDFRHHFCDVGELMFVAFQQILDVAPDFNQRSPIYSSKISEILQVLSDQSTTGNAPLWKSLFLSQWSCIEIHDWLTATTEELNMTSHDQRLLLNAFSRMTGLDLCCKTLDDFKQIHNEYGEALYLSLRHHRTNESGHGDRKRHRSSGDLTSIPEDAE